MNKVPGLGEIDLAGVLGVSLTAEAQLHMVRIGQRIDSLCRLGDEPGWIIGNGPQVVSAGQPLPLALGTAIGRRYEPGDWLELALDVWYAIEGSLLVTTAVEVACLCPADHNMHAAAGAEWRAESPDQLLAAFADAGEMLAGWSKESDLPDVWRRRADLL